MEDIPGLKTEEEIVFQEEFLDLSKFEKVTMTDDWKFGFTYEVVNDNIHYNAKISQKDIKDYSDDELTYFMQDLNLISRIDHPLILKSLGYSPVNFNNFPNPVIITEPICHNLFYYFDNELNSTQKLIIIHGIASAMSFLHFHDIIHRDLTPNSVYIDSSFYPKIANFGFSIHISKNDNNQDFQFMSEIIGTPLYCSPEILQNQVYSKASDVYSFSLILFQLITNEKPFKTIKNLSDLYNEVVTNNKRPEIPEKTPKCYRSLIEKCWSKNPNERPIFEKIVEILEKTKEFITEDVNEEEYLNYVEKIKKYKTKIIEKNRFNKREDLMKKENETTNKNILKFAANIQIDTSKAVNLNNFKKMEEISNGSSGKVIKIMEKETKNIFAAKIYTDELDKKSKEFLSKLSNEINIHSYLNHPSIAKFIGFSPRNFENEVYPVLVTEFLPNGSLHNIIEKSYSFFSPHEWNITKKLINIYGIASGMAYLHSNGILYGDLNPLNILEDENYYPKICDFGKSFFSSNKIEIGEFGGELIYTAPETINDSQYSTASDVYSFGMLIYVMLTNEEPFKNEKRSVIYSNISQGLLPEFNDDIPEIFQALIESCWKFDPDERTSFDYIIKTMKSMPDFIIEGVNKNEFLDYVEYIDSFTSSFNNKNPVIQIDENYNFEDDDDTEEEEENDYITNDQLLEIQKKYDKFESLEKGTCNIKDFLKKSKIGEGSFGATYKVTEKKTNFLYAAKISKNELNFDSKERTINLSREVSIISKLNHPSIIKFIAYSPTNFSNVTKPVIITEFAPGGSLDDIIKTERKSITIDGWDDTKKLINIFGIASSMEYLHSLEIIHRDLKPENILLDKYLCPKLADFGLSKYIYDIQEQNEVKSSDDVKGTPSYLSPEIWSANEYSKAGDVYSFALILYEIITNQTIYKDINYFQLINIVCTKKSRPQFTVPIPECYQSLIEECWAQDPDERPTFKEIVDLLKNDPDFISSIIDESEYIDYVDSIEQPENSSNIKAFQKVVYHPKKKNKKTTYIHQENFLDLSNYEIKGLIHKSQYSKIVKAIDKETNITYAAKISKITIDDLSEGEFASLSHEVNLLSQLNHPSILKFIGYSPTNMKKEQKPVILTEYLSMGSLDDLFKMEKKEKKKLGWNKTKKLILVYGIAHSMFYLHSKEILHRDLKPSNILLDDDLHPKLTDFGLSVKQHRLYSMTYQSSIVISHKSTYSAPEVLNCETFTKESDVYSFAMIFYQIITEKVPFKKIKNDQQLLEEVYFNNKRPEFPDKIPDCYRNLIESCWAPNPNDRLSFDQIVEILENMPEFISNDVDEKEFKEYINYVKSYDSSFSPKSRLLELEDFEIIHNESNYEDDDNNKSTIVSNKKLENNNNMKIIERSTDEENNKKVKINEMEKSNDSLSSPYEENEQLKIVEREVNIDEDEDQNEKQDADSNQGNENHDKNNDAIRVIEVENEILNTESNSQSDDYETTQEKEIHNQEENLTDIQENIHQSFHVTDQSENKTETNLNDNLVNNAENHQQNDEKETNLNDNLMNNTENRQQNDEKETNQPESIQNEISNEHQIDVKENSPPFPHEEFIYDKNFVHKCLTEKNTKELIQYLNENCDYETTSSVFDQVSNEFPSLYNELCSEGISLNNPVAHHKYALSLIFNHDSNEADFKAARNHLEKSIQIGFTLSYFTLSRLLHEHFNDEKAAFQIAKEGAEKGDKCSMCLLGIYFTRGIGTKKDRKTGVPLMIQSGVEQLYEQFATDIGLFYIESNENDSDEEAFKWFEKAYLMKKTKATINNYGLCFLIGIYVQKDVEKAKMIFLDGAKIGDSNLMYILAHILEKTDPKESLEYYKLAAKLGHTNSQIYYASLINKKRSNDLSKLKELDFDQNQLESQFSCEFLSEEVDSQKLNEDIKKEAEKGNKNASSFLAKNYSQDQEEPENTFKYMMICLKSGKTMVPLEYAINLYKSKHYESAFNYFTMISKHNDPIAKYFIGVMKFYGHGCKKNINESYHIMKELADNGIDRAVEFIENNFAEFNHK